MGKKHTFEQWISAPGRLSAAIGGVAFSIRHVGPLKSMYWLYANNSRVQWPLGGGYADSVNFFSTPGAAKKFVEQNLQVLLAHYGPRIISRNPARRAYTDKFFPSGGS